jgi:hypothetical protein
MSRAPLPSPPGSFGAGTPYKRRCVLCLRHRQMAGGRTTRDGKRWICAECRAKQISKETT